MIKLIKTWVHRVRDYDNLNNLYLSLETVNADNVSKYLAVLKQLENCKSSLPHEPDVMDAGYWNNLYKQKRIYYSAPNRKLVTWYLKYRNIPEVNEIALFFKEIDPDRIVLECLIWLDSRFKEEFFTYKKDKGEVWNTPEQTFKSFEIDCDDTGILLYYIIRQRFKDVQIWEQNKHRLWCQDIHVHESNQDHAYAGRHFNLIWLHSDGKIYTVESTFYRSRSILNFGTKPQAENPQYGLINYTFNESIMRLHHNLCRE